MLLVVAEVILERVFVFCPCVDVVGLASVVVGSVVHCDLLAHPVASQTQ